MAEPVKNTKIAYLRFFFKKSTLTRLIIRSAKTDEKRLHVIPSKGKWGVKFEGEDRMYRVYPRKALALKLAKERAILQGKTMVIVHNKDGRITSTSTYE